MLVRRAKRKLAQCSRYVITVARLRLIVPINLLQLASLKNDEGDPKKERVMQEGDLLMK